MKVRINHPAALGPLVRASRKAQKLRQDDAAGSIGVNENFLGKIERGSESVQWGKLFQVLEGLGIRVILEFSDDEENQIHGITTTTTTEQGQARVTDACKRSSTKP